MEIIEVSPQEYNDRLPKQGIVYNSVTFSELNRRKAERVRYCLFVDDSRVRGGIILGERQGRLLSPFSAPFGGVTVKGNPSLATIEAMAAALLAHCRREGLGLSVTLAPEIYEPHTVAKWVYALSREGMHCDMLLDNYFDLRDDIAMSSMAQRALRKAKASGLEVTAGKSASLIDRCYDIFERHHRAKGYPLHMSKDEVIDTTWIIDADFFLVSREGQEIAAAMVYYVVPSVHQLIYWGDVDDNTLLRPMNFLADAMTSYYRARGEKILDLGPSGDFEQMSPGLIDFKENLGCLTTAKYRFSI